MRLACRIAFLIVAASLSGAAQAQVIINEVAWMGTDQGGANCEWIELRNLGSEVVDLAGWTLSIENAGASSPKVIALGEAASVKYGGIAANGYYLVARDSGACKDLAPATSADWLGSFGSGISNSGAKLVLRSAGGEEDALDSSAGWEAAKGGAGGKNATPKETPQKAGAAWLTALPTPRGQNHSAPLAELPEEEPAISTPVVTVGGTAPLVPVNDPVPELFVDAGPARIVLANAETAFSAVAYDSVGNLRRNADITWSFGDGSRSSGSEVSHAYRKAGEYTAVARARDKGVSAVALVRVTVTDASLRIVEVSDEGVTLANDGDRMADLSSWKLRIGRKETRLPEDTVIAARGTAFFPYENLRGASSTDVALAYPSGKVAYAYEKPPALEPELQQVQDVAPARSLASNRTFSYADAVLAPAAQATLAAAGAPVPEEPRTVVLKDEGSGTIGSIFRSLLASVAAIVLP